MHGNSTFSIRNLDSTPFRFDQRSRSPPSSDERLKSPRARENGAKTWDIPLSDAGPLDDLDDLVQNCRENNMNRPHLVSKLVRITLWSNENQVANARNARAALVHQTVLPELATKAIIQ